MHRLRQPNPPPPTFCPPLSNYTLAINCNAYASLSNFFSTAFPWLPSAVTVAMNAAFPSSAEELDVSDASAAPGLGVPLALPPAAPLNTCVAYMHCSLQVYVSNAAWGVR